PGRALEEAHLRAQQPRHADADDAEQHDREQDLDERERAAARGGAHRARGHEEKSEPAGGAERSSATVSGRNAVFVGVMMICTRVMTPVTAVVVTQRVCGYAGGVVIVVQPVFPAIDANGIVV